MSQIRRHGVPNQIHPVKAKYDSPTDSRARVPFSVFPSSPVPLFFETTCKGGVRAFYQIHPQTREFVFPFLSSSPPPSLYFAR